MIDAAAAKLKELEALWDRVRERPITGLFDVTADRFETFSARCGNILFDYSKTAIDGEARSLLFELAAAADLPAKKQALFSGVHINATEGRAVQHMALRKIGGEPVMLDGEDVIPAIREVRESMSDFASAIRNGSIAGKGGRFTDIVNIGIGGSDLGPKMAALALAPYHDGPHTHFVSNIDGADINSVLASINAETTLFIIASKTFTTQETMTNAKTAREWFVDRCGEDAVGDHFVALSTALDKTSDFGISDNRAFGFWDWVGGRYSVWSAIGLSLMIAIGPQRFEEFLAGAEEVDSHFQTAADAENLPLLMGLVGIWHRNVCGYNTHAVLPYDQHLSRFPAYLQQLDMESNGKRIGFDGAPVEHDTGPIVWGEPGTNGQHAFYQLIHQGTPVVPADFLIAANANEPVGDHHQKLAANAFAQTEALMVGKSLEQVKSELQEKGMDKSSIDGLAPHKVFPGNRPTCTFLYPKLTPHVLGQLIALYEHKVFVQGAIWNINSFDQWGVELGKELAGELLPVVKGETEADGRNASTRGLIEAFRAMRE